MTTAAESMHGALNPGQQSFGQMIFVSCAVHVVLVFFLSYWKWISPGAPLIPLEPAISVDMVSLPEFHTSPTRASKSLPEKTVVPLPDTPKSKDTIPPKEVSVASPEEHKASPKEAASIEEAKRPDPTPEPESKGLDDAGKLATAQVISRQKTKALAAKYSSQGDDEAASAGGMTSGQAQNLDPNWGKAIRDQVQNKWVVLPTFNGQNIRVLVNVRLDAEGGIRTISISESSGNASFDESAIRAVRKAAPLPLPSHETVRRAVLAEGFVLGFNPKGLAS